MRAVEACPTAGFRGRLVVDRTERAVGHRLVATEFETVDGSSRFYSTHPARLTGASGLRVRGTRCAGGADARHLLTPAASGPRGGHGGIPDNARSRWMPVAASVQRKRERAIQFRTARGVGSQAGRGERRLIRGSGDENSLWPNLVGTNREVEFLAR